MGSHSSRSVPCFYFFFYSMFDVERSMLEVHFSVNFSALIAMQIFCIEDIRKCRLCMKSSIEDRFGSMVRFDFECGFLAHVPQNPIDFKGQ